MLAQPCSVDIELYVLSQVGTIMAASDRFNITVVGRGGHAGLPHRAKDPVFAAASLVTALQVCSHSRVTRVTSCVLPSPGGWQGCRRYAVNICGQGHCTGVELAAGWVATGSGIPA
jgi:hypothetical protein